MSDSPSNVSVVEMRAKFEAAKELLDTTKRNLQLVDTQIQALQGGRVAVERAADVSSEHRVAWFGAVDALDGLPGINLGGSVVGDFGWESPHRGIIRVQEDAAFVVTNILAIRRNESVFGPFFAEEIDQNTAILMLRLTDGNTGRSLITGMTEGPKDLDRGALSFSSLSSIRSGLGANVKNKLFAEFTLPRASVVHAEVYNVGERVDATRRRAFVSLFGYKVYGA